MYIYICNHENNVPSQFSPQWLCSNSCIWEDGIWLYITVTNESKSSQQAKNCLKTSFI